MEVAVSERKKLMIMAAGTGGHIFPGLAIAATMQKEGWDVTWLGTQHGMEGKIVPAAGIEMESIDFAGLRGKGLAHTIGGSIKLMTSFMTCRGIMKRRKPDLVVGMGGYVTVPGGMQRECSVFLSCWSMRTPNCCCRTRHWPLRQNMCCSVCRVNMGKSLIKRY